MIRVVVGLVLVLALTACVSDGTGGRTPSTGVPTTAAPTPVTPFCRRLEALDEQLRLVRSIDDAEASVGRYEEGSAALDIAFRRARDVAPEGVDLAPIEYANGRLGEIVRAMPPDLPGPDARAQVALILAAYDDAMLKTLLSACGPSSIGA